MRFAHRLRHSRLGDHGGCAAGRRAAPARVARRRPHAGHVRHARAAAAGSAGAPGVRIDARDALHDSGALGARGAPGVQPGALAGPGAHSDRCAAVAAAGGPDVHNDRLPAGDAAVRAAAAAAAGAAGAAARAHRRRRRRHSLRHPRRNHRRRSRRGRGAARRIWRGFRRVRGNNGLRTAANIRSGRGHRRAANRAPGSCIFRAAAPHCHVDAGRGRCRHCCCPTFPGDAVHRGRDGGHRSADDC